MKRSRLIALCGLAVAAATAQAAKPEEILAAYAKQAGEAPSPERGQRFFVEQRTGGLFPSCASCHGEVPTGNGRDLVRESTLAPLAPAANPKRFTDPTKVEYRFSVNCKDMVGRECTAQEKADVLSWLLTLKP
jgi:hypothetical protein